MTKSQVTILAIIFQNSEIFLEKLLKSRIEFAFLPLQKIEKFDLQSNSFNSKHSNEHLQNLQLNLQKLNWVLNFYNQNLSKINLKIDSIANQPMHAQKLIQVFGRRQEILELADNLQKHQKINEQIPLLKKQNFNQHTTNYFGFELMRLTNQFLDYLQPRIIQDQKTIFWQKEINKLKLIPLTVGQQLQFPTSLQTYFEDFLVEKKVEKNIFWTKEQFLEQLQLLQTKIGVYLQQQGINPLQTNEEIYLNLLALFMLLQNWTKLEDPEYTNEQKDLTKVCFLAVNQHEITNLEQTFSKQNCIYVPAVSDLEPIMSSYDNQINILRQFQKKQELVPNFNFKAASFLGFFVADGIYGFFLLLFCLLPKKVFPNSLSNSESLYSKFMLLLAICMILFGAVSGFWAGNLFGDFGFDNVNNLLKNLQLIDFFNLDSPFIFNRLFNRLLNGYSLVKFIGTICLILTLIFVIASFTIQVYHSINQKNSFSLFIWLQKTLFWLQFSFAVFSLHVISWSISNLVSKVMLGSNLEALFVALSLLSGHFLVLLCSLFFGLLLWLRLFWLGFEYKTN